MTRPVDTAPLSVLPGAAEAPVRRARPGTDRSRGAPVLFGLAPDQRAALGSTLSRVTAAGDAWLAYRVALLAEICAALGLNVADLLERPIGLVRPPMAVGTAGLHVGPAGFHLHPIASAGARQGLPTAITLGAAS